MLFIISCGIISLTNSDNSLNFSNIPGESNLCFSACSVMASIASDNFSSFSISFFDWSMEFLSDCFSSQSISLDLSILSSVSFNASFKSSISSNSVIISSMILSSDSSTLSYRSARDGTLAIKVFDIVFLGPEISSLSVNSKWKCTSSSGMSIKSVKSQYVTIF